jgi:hypothetical protein
VTAATPAAPAGPAVYRAWAPDGTLLYIGSSKRPRERVRAHLRRSGLGEVARWEFEEYPVIEDARAAEGRAIFDEGPKYNVAGVPRCDGECSHPCCKWRRATEPPPLSCWSCRGKGREAAARCDAEARKRAQAQARREAESERQLRELQRRGVKVWLRPTAERARARRSSAA